MFTKKIKKNWLLLIGIFASSTWLVYVALQVFTYMRDQERRQEFFNDEAVKNLITRYTSETSPVFSIPIDEVLGQKRKFSVTNELIVPASALPQAYRFNREALATLYKVEKNCDLPIPPIDRFNDPSLKKYASFLRFLCKKEPLANDFLKKPPHTSPLGGSWARQLLRRDIISFEEALPYLHFLEIAQFTNSDKPLPLELLNISPEALGELNSGVSIVPSPNLLLIIDRNGQLRGYSGASWQAHLERNFTTYRRESMDSCNGILLHKLCWQKASPKNEKKIIPQLLTTLAMLALWLAFAAWLRVQSRRKNREEHDLMIQTLAHELRHPAASIELSLESFRRDFDTLPDIAKDEFLRMTDQVQKLSRVIHASRSYLQSNQDGGSSFRFDFRSLDSIFDFVREVIAPYEGKVESIFLGTDGKGSIDPYWTSLCITNLVKNSLIHGKQPITIQVELVENEISIKVSDSGESNLSLEEMLSPFRKREGSPGMGLGLSLTSRIAQRMGGSLNFQNKPTTFILLFPRFMSGESNV